MTQDQQRALAEKRSKEAQERAKRENNGGKTGSPPGMLQDDCRSLSKALASAPHARQNVLEACADIKQGAEKWPRA
jgi:hypothetical protein